MNAIASLGLCNVASLNIYDIKYGANDYVVASINDQKPRKYKLYSTLKGDYFNFGGSRYYTHEFCRV